MANETNEKIANTPLGNTEAMREALENIKQEAETTYEYMDYPVAGSPGERGTCPVVDADWIVDKCRAALSAPARNCDLYNDVEDAWQDYKQFRSQTGEAIYFDMVHFWPFAKWLFATAKQKGEGDGR